MTKSPLALAALALTALPALADTTAMCLERNSEEVCSCATEALATAVSEEDAAHYDAIGTLFITNREAGQGWVDAWDAAVAGVAEQTGMQASALQRAMNPVGKAHQEAIKGCE